jgi:outer membrane lipoprotein
VKNKDRILLVFLIFILFSCTSIIAPELKKEITLDVTLAQVQKKPDLFKEKTVMWGGRILRGTNKKEGTLFEILALPLDKKGRPKQVDESFGRFLAIYKGYLDIAIYTKGREITIIGEIKETKIKPIGKFDYKYPLLEARKVHLWKMRPEIIDLYHHWWPYPPYPYWYSPPYWYWP